MLLAERDELAAMVVNGEAARAQLASRMAELGAEAGDQLDRHADLERQIEALADRADSADVIAARLAAEAADLAEGGPAPALPRSPPELAGRVVPSAPGAGDIATMPRRRSGVPQISAQERRRRSEILAEKMPHRVPAPAPRRRSDSPSGVTVRLLGLLVIAVVIAMLVLIISGEQLPIAP